MGDYHPNLNEIRTKELNEIVQNLRKTVIFEGSSDFIDWLRTICEEYSDIFAYI